MPAPTLSDGQVTIRAPRESDVAGCLEQCTDPLSITWTQVPLGYTTEMAREFLLDHAPAAWADGSQWIFAVESQGYAGNIALRDEGSGRAEIAYGAHPAARGSGAMERALRLLLEWGFTEKALRTVIWRADVGNWASRKTAWRLGFTLDGMLRQSHVSRGEIVDAWLGTLRAGEPRTPSHAWLTSPVLETGDLRLRPTRVSDVPRIVEACGDARTRHWLGSMPSPYGEADARGWFLAMAEKQATGAGTTWAIADAASDALLGAISVFDLTTGQVCEIGYWTHPEARGSGVMTSAVRRVVTYAFDQLGVPRVRAVAAVDNAASRHVIEAAGLRSVGVERLATRTAEGLADTVLYDVLATEWAERSVRR